MLKAYKSEEVFQALNTVAPYDWRKFWQERRTSLSAQAPLNGIEAGGWRLVYSDKRNLPIDVAAKEEKRCNERFSIGLLLDNDGRIVDVVANSPADVAKLAPSMKIVAVNSRVFSLDCLREAIKAAPEPGAGPLELIGTNSDYYQTVHID